MKITFKIQESLQQIIDEITNPSEHWETVVFDDGTIGLKDPSFYNHAVCKIDSGVVEIITAWSGFIYRIYETDGETYCQYEGAYRALLMQNLLPTITPLFTGYERVESSLKLIPILNEYIDIQGDFADWRKKHKSLQTHPHPNCIYKWVEQESID